VGRHAAVEIAVAHEQEIDTDRRIGVGPGFEILCDCTGATMMSEADANRTNLTTQSLYFIHIRSLPVRTPEFYVLL